MTSPACRALAEENAAGLIIDSNHVYRLNDKIIPSVTQIINAVIPRKYQPDPWYLERGSALHAAINCYARGEVDRTLNHDYEGKLSAFHKFIAETKAEIVESEVMLSSLGRSFAGTYDAVLQIGEARHRGVRILCDWKSSVLPTADLQLGAYSLLLFANGKPPCAKAVAVHLKDNGNFSCRWVDLKNAEKAFLSVLNVYNWMEKNKMLIEQKEN